MAGASVQFKRLLLRGISWDAQKNGLRLRAALQAACQARIEESRTGRVLVGTSGNGSSVTFALPSASSALTPESVLNALSELYDLYEVVISELASDEETASDDAILTRMLAITTKRNEVYSDRSGMVLR